MVSSFPICGLCLCFLSCLHSFNSFSRMFGWYGNVGIEIRIAKAHNVSYEMSEVDGVS